MVYAREVMKKKENRMENLDGMIHLLAEEVNIQILIKDLELIGVNLEIFLINMVLTMGLDLQIIVVLLRPMELAENSH